MSELKQIFWGNKTPESYILKAEVALLLKLRSNYIKNYWPNQLKIFEILYRNSPINKKQCLQMIMDLVNQGCLPSKEELNIFIKNSTKLGFSPIEIQKFETLVKTQAQQQVQNLINFNA